MVMDFLSTTNPGMTGLEAGAENVCEPSDVVILLVRSRVLELRKLENCVINKHLEERK